MANSWVLIGLREWEVVANNKLEKCDLLEVYNNTEKEKIINTLNNNELVNIINIGEENSEIDKNISGFNIIDHDDDLNLEEDVNDIDDDKQNIDLNNDSDNELIDVDEI